MCCFWSYWDGNPHIIGGVGSDEEEATELMEACMSLQSIKGAIWNGIGHRKII